MKIRTQRNTNRLSINELEFRDEISKIRFHWLKLTNEELETITKIAKRF
jgi:hypothetical protein